MPICLPAIPCLVLSRRHSLRSFTDLLFISILTVFLPISNIFLPKLTILFCSDFSQHKIRLVTLIDTKSFNQQFASSFHFPEGELLTYTHRQGDLVTSNAPFWIYDRLILWNPLLFNIHTVAHSMICIHKWFRLSFDFIKSVVNFIIET